MSRESTKSSIYNYDLRKVVFWSLNSKFCENFESKSNKLHFFLFSIYCYPEAIDRNVINKNDNGKWLRKGLKFLRSKSLRMSQPKLKLFKALKLSESTAKSFFTAFFAQIKCSKWGEFWHQRLFQPFHAN